MLYAVDRIEYLNAGGTYVLKNDGKRKKSFSQRRPDSSGGWIRNVDGVARVPYRLPELIDAVASGHLIFIAEGEACVDAIRDRGVAATTNPSGAGKWFPEFNEYLRGADVVLLPDNDTPGWKHINDVGASLVGIAARTRVVMLPGLGEKGDIRDWLDAGGTREQLDALVEIPQDWQPPAAANEAPVDTAAKDKAAADEQARQRRVGQAFQAGL